MSAVSIENRAAPSGSDVTYKAYRYLSIVSRREQRQQFVCSAPIDAQASHPCINAITTLRPVAEPVLPGLEPADVVAHSLAERPLVQSRCT